ncbi:MAG: permease [Saprospirales bacterium]|nr:permease [Saprospirales bacterium]|tara:strand:- start:5448 stop:6266 length:819 start_codon:yes stop_codon:yes gene_type:complete
MEGIVLIGYTAAVFIGLIVGLTGAGGSILALPILTYFFGVPAELATGYSLFVVGWVAAVGALRNGQKGNIDYKIATVFAPPTIAAVYFTRKVIVPAIPETIIQFEEVALSKDLAIMLLFAIVMLFASISMLRKKTHNTSDSIDLKWDLSRVLKVVIEATVVGVLTGLVGAGGGFIIVPALVLLAKLPIHRAVGTSMFIIASKSLIGFLGDVTNPSLIIDWTFLIGFTFVAMLGLAVGLPFSAKVPAPKLKKGFGVFVLVMAVFILVDKISSL